jgi:2-keto-3-deoxy-L-fuconate dehydrogenase
MNVLRTTWVGFQGGQSQLEHAMDRMSAMTDYFRLDGKVALITGGASGIGEATSLTLTEAGARVIILDLDEARASQLAKRCPGARVFRCDITQEEDVKRVFDQLDELDILVNNAGIGLVGNIEETTLAEFQRLFRVNVDGVFLMTRAALPLLLKSKGSIVNISSVAGLVGVKRRYAYCGTKGAVIALTRQLAVDYPTQIRVNCIAPGTVDTPFIEAYLEKYHKDEKEKVREELNSRQPVGRLGRPEEIARLALYLCSPAADFMNGAVVPIDGGWTAA